MCRIASPFLLQRLKRSLSGDARDFTNIREASCHQGFFFLQGKAPKEIHAILTETLGEHTPSYYKLCGRIGNEKHIRISRDKF